MEGASITWSTYGVPMLDTKTLRFCYVGITGVDTYMDHLSPVQQVVDIFVPEEPRKRIPHIYKCA